MTDQLSKCCKSEIKFHSSNEGTGYMSCTRCEKACDIYCGDVQQTQGKTWKESYKEMLEKQGLEFTEWGSIQIWKEGEQFIDSLLSQQRTALLDRVEDESKKYVIADCENCGEEGWGKSWYGHGRETGDSYGDRYEPTGDVVLCKSCFSEYGEIGKYWNGEKIWKCTSSSEKHDTIRLNSIKRKITIAEVVSNLKNEYE